MNLPKNTSINEHVIKLVEDKQLPYGPNYSLEPVELKTLKIYIEIYLKNRFIWLFKSPANALIFFNQKPDRSLRLCIDYQSWNNLIIKNWYPFFLINETLNRLGCAKCFTQLDLTTTYHKMRIWESNNWKTVFYIRYGHFEYQIIFFRFFNTPTSFQAYINKIFIKKLDIFIIVYLDNILIYIKELGQLYMKAIYWVFN